MKVAARREQFERAAAIGPGPIGASCLEAAGAARFGGGIQG
jgi:hypothetical protein